MKPLALLLPLLFFIACGDSADSSDINYDEAFIVEQSKMYTFPDGGTIQGISISNSYCPCNAQCIWEGEAIVVISHTDALGNAKEITIHETQVDLNPPGYSISSVKTDESCEPVIEEILITVGAREVNTCGEATIIDDNLYDKGPNSKATISGASIAGDCLTLTYSASGCDGNSWKVALYGTSAVAESSPEQRYIRMSLDNSEACLAVFTKEAFFDLTPLQIQNGGVLILNLEGHDQGLRYEY